MPGTDIDTSMYSKLVPTPLDPMGMAGKVQALQSSILQNRLVNQNLQSKVQGGKALAGAIDPNTGLPDAAKVGQYFTDHPEAAPYAGEALSTAQTLQTGQLGNEQTKLTNARAQLGLTTDQGKLISNGLLPFIQKFSTPGPDGQLPTPTAEDFRQNLVSTLQNMGSAMDANVQNRAAALYESVKADPSKAVEAAKHIALIGNPTPETMTMLFGNLEKTDTGGKTLTTQTPTLGGPMVTRGAVAKELTPEFQATLVDTVDNNPQSPTYGQTIKVPRAQIGGAPAGGAPRDGRYPAGGAGGPAVAALAPGEASSIAASKDASAGIFQKDVAEAGGYSQRLQGLNKAYENLTKSTTGAGAKGLQNFGAVLNTFGIKAPTDVNSYAQAEKYLQDYANQRGANLGMGTDQSRAMVQAANPGVHSPKDAALHVLDVFKGLERMQAAQVAAAQAEKVPPGQYNEWKAKWSRSVDPAAFNPPHLDKAGWEAKRKALGDKWPAYQKGLEAALSAGVLSPADLRK